MGWHQRCLPADETRDSLSDQRVSWGEAESQARLQMGVTRGQVRSSVPGRGPALGANAEPRAGLAGPQHLLCTSLLCELPTGTNTRNLRAPLGIILKSGISRTSGVQRHIEVGPVGHCQPLILPNKNN